MTTQELWEPDVISVRPGAGIWIEVKAPRHLAEGARSLMGTRLVYEGREREVCGWHSDETSAIARGESVTINLKSVE